VTNIFYNLSLKARAEASWARLALVDFCPWDEMEVYSGQEHHFRH
jgi:hypothetical protein